MEKMYKETLAQILNDGLADLASWDVPFWRNPIPLENGARATFQRCLGRNLIVSGQCMVCFSEYRVRAEMDQIPQGGEGGV